MFKVGDKVRLKKEFYKEEEFKGMSRSLKKPIAYLQGKSVSVVSVPNFNRNDVAIIITDGVDIYIFPPCIFELVEPEKKPVVEVKRVAKVGEWIKIVAEEDAKGLYKNGDILKVNGLILGICIIVYGRVIYHREYVVLENYKPEDKPSSPHKRKWTEEEITKSKCFLAEELIHHHCNFSVFGNETRCYCFARCKTAASKPDAKDEYNEYIGAAVAYCKASGVKIPEFIKH